jgi:two-component system chemotaxis response regulator CheB
VADEISVLIVDDSALMRNLIAHMVEDTPGLAVAEKAMNGIFALQKIPRVNPDVICLDLEMPEMNGIEFLKKRQELKIDIPVVILSSVAARGAQITMEALSLGASDFVQKPSGSISEDIHVVKNTLTSMLWVTAARTEKRKAEKFFRLPNTSQKHRRKKLRILRYIFRLPRPSLWRLPNRPLPCAVPELRK